VRSVAGKITRSGLDTRTSRPPASTVRASEAGICAKLPRMAQLEVVQADITQLDVDAVTNAANTQLAHGGGVAAAIQRAAGEQLAEESRAKAPIGLGDAVETTAGDMPSRWVIHAATMELGGPTSAEIIERATRSTLRVAERLGCKSLALVAFGTGVGGFPLDEAARIMVDAARAHEGGLERIVFAVHGDEAEHAFQGAVESK
jgi:O-acetyl-ADP-ribose deacetylase